MRKIPFAGIELTSQRVRGLRGTSELPGRPGKSIDQPGKVANPARGQLIRENDYNSALAPFAPENLVSRDGFDRPFPSRVSLLILHTRAQSDWLMLIVLPHGIPPDFRGCVHVFLPPYAIESVPGLSGRIIAYRWCSLARIRRHRASSPQGSYSNGCCICRSPWTN